MTEAAVLLLSGGIDSTAIAAWRRPSHAMFVDYGQRAAATEARAATYIAHELELDLAVVEVRTTRHRRAGSDPPHWAYRNQLLVTVAAAYAAEVAVDEVWVGTVASDGARNIDGTIEFVSGLDELLRMQEEGVGLTAPALDLTSDALIARSGISDSLLAATVSCYSPAPCGTCGGCVRRRWVLRRVNRLQGPQPS